MRDHDWHVLPPDPAGAAALARALGISPLLGQLLLNRGQRELPAARRFLQPSLDGLQDPFLLPGLRAAADRLARAIHGGERIHVYGDYDVDGVTGTAMLVRCLRHLGVDAGYTIPHRVDDGYGLSLEAVERLAGEGVKVLVTVDCGTTDVEEVRRARERGMDVIVTDHHEPPAELPAPCALVNPKLGGPAAGGRELCGAGVAFKLAWALLQGLPPARRREPAFQELLLEAVALTALATVADVVPLTGENRIFAAYGLVALRQSRNPGLRALLERSGLTDEPLEASHLAFRLAPRLNAGGRLGSALQSVRLFLSADPAEAASIADALEAANADRQRVESRILREARARIAEEHDLARDRAIVLADDRWHAGVIGIVAARLMEEHRRPVVLVALTGDRGRGSGRSIPGFPLHEALARCREHLIGCGGHALAAGLEIARDRVGPFRGQLLAAAAEAFPGALPNPRLTVDAEVTLDVLDVPSAREIGRLAPHGAGNAAPVLAVRGVRVAGEPRRMGKKGDHISFRVAQRGAGLRAVWWGGADRLDGRLDGSRDCDIAFAPSLNAWGGEEKVELIVKDLKACGQ